MHLVLFLHRRIDQLESSNDSEIATLPIAQAHSTGMGMRSISQGSLDMTSRLTSMRPHAIEPRAISPDEDVCGSIMLDQCAHAIGS